MPDLTVARYDVFEHTITAKVDGNPYVDVEFWGVFKHANRKIRVPGFYDGEGLFKVRLMPDIEGEWSLTTESDVAALNDQTASFTVTAAREGVHGPVSVRNKFHFGYADGTPYLPFGTTCYVWTHQTQELQAQTLKTLETAGFNKMRMCVFPKHYPYNENEPELHVYEARGDGTQDFDKPVFEAFRHFEKQVAALGDLGIEADIIIFHPYDRWGYADMSPEQDYRYLKYLVARLAAYRNVWWSLANEYDFLLNTKPMEMWDRFFQIIEENDPYRHLKSIHQGNPELLYNHRRPWVDHVCIQHPDVQRTVNWRTDFGKPLVNDELQYEGDIIQTWGNITAEEVVHRFWLTMLKGGYAGHGETYSREDDVLWWAKGGVLHGQSPKRIAFMRKIFEEDAKNGLTPFEEIYHSGYPWSSIAAARDGEVSYFYFGAHRPVIWSTGLPLEDGDYELDIIDTWNMTITPAKKVAAPVAVPTRHGDVVRGGEPDAAFGVELPGKPNLALRVRPRR